MSTNINMLEYSLLNDSIYNSDSDYLECYRSHQQFNRTIFLIINEHPKPSSVKLTERYIKTLQQKLEMEANATRKKEYSSLYYRNNKQKYKSFKGDPLLYKKRGRPRKVLIPASQSP